jgi:hypothetical protein
MLHVSLKLMFPFFFFIIDCLFIDYWLWGENRQRWLERTCWIAWRDYDVMEWQSWLLPQCAYLSHNRLRIKGNKIMRYLSFKITLLARLMWAVSHYWVRRVIYQCVNYIMMAITCEMWSDATSSSSSIDEIFFIWIFFYDVNSWNLVIA